MDSVFIPLEVSSLDEAHQDSRAIFFQKGLPFYTCIDSLQNIWQKEMPDGTTSLVSLKFDWETEKIIEKLFKKLP